MKLSVVKKIKEMTFPEFFWKAKKTLHNKYVMSHRNEEDYFELYKSYRWALKNEGVNKEKLSINSEFYIAARPNPGAGIGHQMGNWNAGYWYAKVFGLKFAHIPFSAAKAPFKANDWDAFLGFGKNEMLYSDLIKSGYKVVKLPAFDEYNQDELEKIKLIMATYSKTHKKIVFLLEQDQTYCDQFGVMDDIQLKFYSCDKRQKEKLRFSENEYNIVMHIRRGDIVIDPGQRWLTNDYFSNVLHNYLKIVKTDKPIHVWIMSQGKEEDYPELKNIDNATFCLDMGAIESFLHMVYADTLITSRSSFSYKPALLNRNIKVCPKNFWHSYPNDSQWLLADDDGVINR